MTAKHNRYLLPSVMDHQRQTREQFAAERAAGLSTPATGHYAGEDLDPSYYRAGAFNHLACPSVISGRSVLPRQYASHLHAIQINPQE